jgi:hypothetical protein
MLAPEAGDDRQGRVRDCCGEDRGARDVQVLDVVDAAMPVGDALSGSLDARVVPM